jgi:hypothetical protein
MRNTTISKMVDYFRTFLKWAHKKRLYKGDLHEIFHPKFKGLGNLSFVDGTDTSV